MSVHAMVLAVRLLPYDEARCVPNLSVRFFGYATRVLSVSGERLVGRRKGVGYVTSSAIVSCRRTSFGKMCSSNSLLESEPECKTL